MDVNCLANHRLSLMMQSLILELCGLRSLEVSGVTEGSGQQTGRPSLRTRSGAPQRQAGHDGGSFSPAEVLKSSGASGVSLWLSFCFLIGLQPFQG